MKRTKYFKILLIFLIVKLMSLKALSCSTNYSDTLYLINGIAGDNRIFSKLDFTGYTIIYIHWVTPEKKETIEHYAGRLAQQITCSKPVLVGVSFGGLIAIELAKKVNAKKVILISSAKTKKEVPFYFRYAGFIRFYKVIPIKYVVRPDFLSYWFLGVKTDNDKEFVEDAFINLNVVFSKWALGQFSIWHNKVELNNLIQIHGDKDRIIPSRFVKSNFKIKGGGHMMILNKSTEISKIVRRCLIE